MVLGENGWSQKKLLLGMIALSPVLLYIVTLKSSIYPANHLRNSLQDFGSFLKTTKDLKSLEPPTKRNISLAKHNLGLRYMTEEQWEKVVKFVTPPLRSFGRGGPERNNVSVPEEHVKTVMKERKEHLERTCSNLGLDPKKRLSRLAIANVWVDKKNMYMFCPMGKISSTNWLSLFWKFSGYLEPTVDTTNPAIFWRKFYGSTLKKVQQDGDNATFIEGHVNLDKSMWSFWVENSSKTLEVRHPFERLASSYRNKVIEINYVRKLLLDRRPKNQTNMPLIPDFGEFADLLIHEWKQQNNRGSALAHDFHWDTAFSRCSPCDLHWKYIIHYEHLKEEANFVLKQWNAPLKDFPTTSNFYAKGDKSSAELSVEYFKTLKYSQIVELIRIFYSDFLLFQYSDKADMDNIFKGSLSPYLNA